MVVQGGLFACCWGWPVRRGPIGALMVSVSRLGVCLCLASLPFSLSFLGFLAPWSLVGLFPCPCSVVFSFRPSVSLGVPFLRLVFAGFVLWRCWSVLVLCLCCFALDFRRPALPVSFPVNLSPKNNSKLRQYAEHACPKAQTYNALTFGTNDPGQHLTAQMSTTSVCRCKIDP